MDAKPGLILQHGPAGPPDILGEWLRERAIEYEVHHAWEAPPPPVEGRPFVASLGSPDTAGDSGPPWVRDEIETMRRAVEADVPVLGLCFGGQTLALALGGELERAAEPEIGWLPVESEDDSVPPGITPELIDAQGARHGAGARAQAWRLFDGWWASR